MFVIKECSGPLLSRPLERRSGGEGCKEEGKIYEALLQASGMILTPIFFVVEYEFVPMMNTSLPMSVETYLKEAGFSQTEMLILRKLLEEHALTIRELGAKMGKSVGLIDQAVKKLMSKRIVRKELINGQPKYLIDSLDAIVKWVHKDMEDRKLTLERRHESFSQFIATLKIDQKRPDMEHFSGLEGIKQAYDKLIASGDELLTFTPVLYLAEDDPLRAYRVDLFRRRQVRKIFQRVLAVDSPLARRFQSRDPFEYRRTLLVPESELPLAFEKTIVGDTVAYIDLKGENACFLKYADLAKAERATFECLWLRTLEQERDGTGTVCALAVPMAVPLRTKIFSYLRDFVLSPRSICMIILFALISGVLTFGLSEKNSALNLHRIKDKVVSIAVTGALQFNPDDIQNLRTENDWRKPEWVRVVTLLSQIRQGNDSIIFAYIVRKKPSDPDTMEFVSDSYSLDPYANTDDDPSNNVDVNHNGIVDGPDLLQWPGQPYDTPPLEAFQAYDGPAVTPDFYEDQWGHEISGYAPIRDVHGKTIAVLAIDMTAFTFDQLNKQTFTPLYAFLGFFFLFILIRFAAENRSFFSLFLPVSKVRA